MYWWIPLAHQKIHKYFRFSTIPNFPKIPKIVFRTACGHSIIERTARRRTKKTFGFPLNIAILGYQFRGSSEEFFVCLILVIFSAAKWQRYCIIYFVINILRNWRGSSLYYFARSPGRSDLSVRSSGCCANCLPVLSIVITEPCSQSNALNLPVLGSQLTAKRLVNKDFSLNVATRFPAAKFEEILHS